MAGCVQDYQNNRDRDLLILGVEEAQRDRADRHQQAVDPSASQKVDLQARRATHQDGRKLRDVVDEWMSWAAVDPSLVDSAVDEASHH